MELKVFAIYDNKAEAFKTPFFMLTVAEAIRAFSNLATEKGHLFNQNPHDFQLFQLGKFDNITGTIDNEVRDMGTAASYKVDQHNVENLYPAKEA